MIEVFGENDALLLENQRRSDTPLEEELKYVRHYVSILQIRFADRLQIMVLEDERFVNAIS